MDRKPVDPTSECPWIVTSFKKLTCSTLKDPVTLPYNHKNGEKSICSQKWRKSIYTFKPRGAATWNLNVQKASLCNSLCRGFSPNVLFTGITSRIKNLKLLDSWWCSIKCYTNRASVTITNPRPVLCHSCHRCHLKWNILFGQFLRLRRNSTMLKDYEFHDKNLVGNFRNGRYPTKVIQEAFMKVSRSNRSILLWKNDAKQTPNKIIFVLNYTSRAMAIKDVIMRHSHIIKHILVCALPPQIGFRKRGSLRDMLVKN